MPSTSRMGFLTRVGAGVAGLVLAISGSSSLAAQDGQASAKGSSWTLNGLRNAQCVRFLMEPGAVGKQRREGYRAVRADQDSSLHSALRNVIASQPEFGSWVPSSLCFFYVDTVALAGRTFADKNGRKAQMIGVWTVATTEREGRRDVVLAFVASSGQVVRAAHAGKLKMREAESRVSKALESSDELREVKIGKTHLVWTGRETGDSTPVEAPIERAWVVGGASGIDWDVQMTLKPRWSRPLVGSLRVEGKDDLAKALKGSPIRFVGPRYFGGSLQLLFSR